MGRIEDKDAKVKLLSGLDFSKLTLTAEEGFLLSRIDNVATVKMLCLGSGLGEQKTMELMEGLFEKGVIQVGEHVAPLPLTGVATHEHQFNSPVPSPKISTEQPGINEPNNLPPEIAISITAFYNNLKKMNFFELLGVTPNVSAKDLKRSYFKRSKEFHPDRFFNKQLGHFKPILQEIFNQLNAAFKVLEDPNRREAYEQTLNQKVSEEEQVAEIKRQGAIAFKEFAIDETTNPKREEGSEYSMQRNRSQDALPRVPTEERRKQDDIRRREMLKSTLPTQLQRANQFYEQGQKQLASGQIVAAATSFKLAATLNPDSEEYCKKRDELMAQSQIITAERLLKQAHFEALVGRNETAINFTLRAVEISKTPSILIPAAKQLLAYGKVAEAKEAAERALTMAPTSKELLLVLGNVYEQAGLLKNAIRQYEELLRIDPTHGDAQKRLQLLKKSV